MIVLERMYSKYDVTATQLTDVTTLLTEHAQDLSCLSGDVKALSPLHATEYRGGSGNIKVVRQPFPIQRPCHKSVFHSIDTTEVYI